MKANYLNIEGVKGESSAANYQGWIDVDSFAFAERQLSQSYSSSGGASTGRVDMEDFVFQMKTNAATPVLFEFCASGKHLKKARLSCCDEFGERLKLIFDDTLVSSLSITSDPASDNLPTVRVSLSFGKISIEYARRQPDGSAAGTTRGGWDLAANKSA